MCKMNRDQVAISHMPWMTLSVEFAYVKTTSFSIRHNHILTTLSDLLKNVEAGIFKDPLSLHILVCW